MRDSTELTAALTRFRPALLTIVGLSALLNILLLAGSIYMMMVYDSVLPSHSIPTLMALLALLVVVYVFQGYFDAIRSRMLSDIGSALDRRLSGRVQQIMRHIGLRGGAGAVDPLTPMRDLDSVRTFLAGPGPAALIDMPWMIIFLGFLFMLHVWLGVTALAGAVILVGLTVLTNRATRSSSEELRVTSSRRYSLVETQLRHVEVIAAMGMQQRLGARWDAVNQAYLTTNGRLSQSITKLGGMSKIFRTFLQSALLTVGALLVIDGKASGGIIFASSILAGRALAPIDQAIANWRGFAQARASWTRLGQLLRAVPATEPLAVALPAPKRSLDVQELSLAPPGLQRLTVANVTFALQAGNILGIVGPSGAGKSSLVRGLTGIWAPARGSVALDGAPLEQWDAERLGSFIGYLPQSVELLEGTVAENIARFDPEARSDAVIAAAQAAGVHDLIVKLPNGYQTALGDNGAALSAGQRQRLGLARALYGDPFLVVLDEPNSNLDSDGEDALETAIAGVGARGGIVVVIAHRSAALSQATHILMMSEGVVQRFGPREVVSRPMGPPVAFQGRPSHAAINKGN
jgi:ATP-binding cassette subfamily C protein